MNPSHLFRLTISLRLCAILVAGSVLAFTGCSKKTPTPGVHLTSTQQMTPVIVPKKPGTSPLIGEPVFVAFQDNIVTSQFRFTVIDVDPHSGMLCLRPIKDVQGSGPPVPVWVPQTSIKFMFGHTGLSDGEFVALQARFNKSATIQR